MQISQEIHNGAFGGGFSWSVPRDCLINTSWWGRFGLASCVVFVKQKINESSGCVLGAAEPYFRSAAASS